VVQVRHLQHFLLHVLGDAAARHVHAFRCGRDLDGLLEVAELELDRHVGRLQRLDHHLPAELLEAAGRDLDAIGAGVHDGDDEVALRVRHDLPRVTRIDVRDQNRGARNDATARIRDRSAHVSDGPLRPGRDRP